MYLNISDSAQEIQYSKNSILVLSMFYSIKPLYGTFSFQKKFRQKNIKLYWQVVDCNVSVSSYYFLLSFSETIVRRVFCSLQSTLIQWRRIKLSLFDPTLQEERFLCELSLSSFTVQISASSFSKLNVKFVSSDFPKRKFNFVLEGVPSDLNFSKMEIATKILLLESIFTNILRIPYYAPAKLLETRILDFAVLEPTWFSQEQVQSTKFRENILLTIQIHLLEKKKKEKNI